MDLFQRCNLLLSKKDKKKINVSPIGLNGVVGKPLFSDKIAEKE